MAEIKYGQLWARHSELVTNNDVGVYRITFEGLQKAVEEVLRIALPLTQERADFIREINNRDLDGRAEQPVDDSARYELGVALRDLIKLAKLPGRSIEEYRKRVDDAEAILAKHSKVTDVLRAAEQPVSEVEFAEWLLQSGYYPIEHHERMWSGKMLGSKLFTTAQLWEVFKKEKV